MAPNFTLKRIVLVLLLILDVVISIRPYVTCVGCDSFVECFITCPVSTYPGVNR